MKTLRSLAALGGILSVALTLGAQPRDTEPLHRPLDQILDINVRDGQVYYRALKSERGRLDRYVASLNVPAATYNEWPREGQMAFWLNAYNAFVLQTVISHYPPKGKAGTYPSSSIRQTSASSTMSKQMATPAMALPRSNTLSRCPKE